MSDHRQTQDAAASHARRDDFHPADAIESLQAAILRVDTTSENRFTRPLRSLDLDRRIDYVFVTTRKKDGRGTVHDCRVVLTEREGAGEAAICASDHYGVCADIQITASLG